MLQPSYPTEFPLEAAGVLLNAVRGGTSQGEGVHAGWIMLGFGAGQLYGAQSGPVPMMATPATPVRSCPPSENDMRLAAELEKCCPTPPAEGEPVRAAAPAVGVFPWATVAPLILDWILRRFGG